MLIVAVTDIWRPHRLIRPLLGTGVLGGFTTFSTFAIEASELSALTASAYVAASVIGGVAAAALGIAAVRKIEPQLHPATTHEQVDPLDPDLP
jgi:CrcB protein